MPPRKRLLFVVATERLDLIGLLQRQFADVVDAVEIVPDRRTAQRRRHDVAVGVDRRVAERRTRDVEDDLRSMGWALVRRRP